MPGNDTVNTNILVMLIKGKWKPQKDSRSNLEISWILGPQAWKVLSLNSHHSAIAFLYHPKTKVDRLLVVLYKPILTNPGRTTAMLPGAVRDLGHHAGSTVHRVPRHPSWPDVPAHGTRRRAHSTASMRYISPVLFVTTSGEMVSRGGACSYSPATRRAPEHPWASTT